MSATKSHLDRIAVDPEIVHGKPRIRGTRVTVQVILELLAVGETIDELLTDYNELTRDDILATLEYAAAITAGTRIQSSSPSQSCKPGWVTPAKPTGALSASG